MSGLSRVLDSLRISADRFPAFAVELIQTQAQHEFRVVELYKKVLSLQPLLVTINADRGQAQVILEAAHKEIIDLEDEIQVVAEVFGRFSESMTAELDPNHEDAKVYLGMFARVKELHEVLNPKQKDLFSEINAVFEKTCKFYNLETTNPSSSVSDLPADSSSSSSSSSPSASTSFSSKTFSSQNLGRFSASLSSTDTLPMPSESTKSLSMIDSFRSGDFTEIFNLLKQRKEEAPEKGESSQQSPLPQIKITRPPSPSSSSSSTAASSLPVSSSLPPASFFDSQRFSSLELKQLLTSPDASKASTETDAANGTSVPPASFFNSSTIEDLPSPSLSSSTLPAASATSASESSHIPPMDTGAAYVPEKGSDDSSGATSTSSPEVGVSGSSENFQFKEKIQSIIKLVKVYETNTNDCNLSAKDVRRINRKYKSDVKSSIAKLSSATRAQLYDNFATAFTLKHKLELPSDTQQLKDWKRRNYALPQNSALLASALSWLIE
jgi:hypothetical protein